MLGPEPLWRFEWSFMSRVCPALSPTRVSMNSNGYAKLALQLAEALCTNGVGHIIGAAERRTAISEQHLLDSSRKRFEQIQMDNAEEPSGAKTYSQTIGGGPTDLL